MVIASHTGSLTRKSKTEEKRYESRSISSILSLDIFRYDFPCVCVSLPQNFPFFLTTLLIKTTPSNPLDEKNRKNKRKFKTLRNAKCFKKKKSRPTTTTSPPLHTSNQRSRKIVTQFPFCSKRIESPKRNIFVASFFRFFFYDRN